MPSLCDVNVLLALCHEDYVHHAATTQWIDKVDKGASIVVCRVAQLGLLRLLNTPAVMLGRPLTVKQAWDVYERLMTDQRFVFSREPQGLEDMLKRIMPGGLVSPKLWQDAYLAAFALASDLNLVTFDAAFKQFAELDLDLLR